MEIKLGNYNVDLNTHRILANDVIFSHEYNPHNVRLWLISNEYGPVAAVWADCEQDAIDEATDAGLMDAFLLEDDDIDEEDMEVGEYSFIGNAGEPADLTNLDIEAVDLSQQSLELLIAFAEARGACADTLDNI